MFCKLFYDTTVCAWFFKNNLCSADNSDPVFEQLYFCPLLRWSHLFGSQQVNTGASWRTQGHALSFHYVYSFLFFFCHHDLNSPPIILILWFQDFASSAGVSVAWKRVAPLQMCLCSVAPQKKIEEDSKEQLLPPERVDFTCLTERNIDGSHSRIYPISPEQNNSQLFALTWDKWRLEGLFLPPQFMQQ